jgi:hypothetical protein
MVELLMMALAAGGKLLIQHFPRSAALNKSREKHISRNGIKCMTIAPRIICGKNSHIYLKYAVK